MVDLWWEGWGRIGRKEQREGGVEVDEGEGELGLPEGVGEAVQHERGLVTEDALLLRPQPEWNEVLVVARRVVHEPNNAALNALEPALVNVELKERKGVARLGRLRVRHVPSLFRGDLEEPIPVGSRAVCRDARHVQTVKPIVC